MLFETRTSPHIHLGNSVALVMRRVLYALAPGLLLRADVVHQRQEVRLALLMIPLALWLPASGIGKALMIASVLLVIVVELINSAVEAAVDRVSLERHHLAKRAKDIGSAAVFVALVNVVVVWALVLFG